MDQLLLAAPTVKSVNVSVLPLQMESADRVNWVVGGIPSNVTVTVSLAVQPLKLVNCSE